MVIIYSYVESDNKKVLKFDTNNVSYSEISASLF